MYSFYIIYSYVVSFYGFMTPLATPALILIFCLHYWVDKYNLFRRFSVPIDFSYQLTNKIVTAFEVSMFLFAIGHFVWDLSVHYDSNTDYRVLNFVSPILSLIYVSFSLFASDSLRKKVFMNKGHPDPNSYNIYMSFPESKFSKTFYSENPATSCLRDLSYLK